MFHGHTLCASATRCEHLGCDYVVNNGTHTLPLSGTDLLTSKQHTANSKQPRWHLLFGVCVLKVSAEY